MKKIKACAARFEAYGEEFSAMDIKLQLGLDVCTTTINNALKEPDKVRWAALAYRMAPPFTRWMASVSKLLKGLSLRLKRQIEPERKRSY